MISSIQKVATLLAFIALPACTTVPAKDPVNVSVASITIERGPCFGFCPVYEVTANDLGEVEFNGRRHTRILGLKESTIGANRFASLELALSGIRPSTSGLSVTPCEALPTDTSMLTITWDEHRADPAILEYQFGCAGPAGDEVAKSVEKALRILGVEAWSAQISRPGVPRGQAESRSGPVDRAERHPPKRQLSSS